MRVASPTIVRDVVRLLEDEGTGLVWLDEDDYAALVQRLAAANGLDHDWIRGALEMGGIELEGHGMVRRYEFVPRNEAAP